MGGSIKLQDQIEAKFKRVRKIATSGFNQAIDYSACIIMLEQGKQGGVHIALEQSGANGAATLLQKALFQHSLVEVMAVFDPVRSGDFHLRVGIEMLGERELFDAVAVRGSAGKLTEAITRFQALEGSTTYETLRHYRNKMGAHLSDFDPGIREPLIEDLITFANSSALAAEAFAHGSGVVTLSLDSQMGAHRASAEAFWRPWRK